MANTITIAGIYAGRGRHDIRAWLLVLALLLGARPSASEELHTRPDRLKHEGQLLFQSCQFKRAAKKFESALALDRRDPELDFWAGKSYARLAEASSPISASRTARKARYYLEKAVANRPDDGEYSEELFEFYLDSPEWFRGGLKSAEKLAKQMDAPGQSQRLAEISITRRDHSGPELSLQRSVQWTSAVVGRFLP